MTCFQGLFGQKLDYGQRGNMTGMILSGVIPDQAALMVTVR
jgi:hypothetical protein